MNFQASIQSGFGSGGYYVSLPYYFGEFRRFLGKDPFPGTLNVKIDESEIEAYYTHLATLKPFIIPAKVEEGQNHWKVLCFPCKLSIPAASDSEEIDCVALEFSNPEHKRGLVELVSSVQLRAYFGLQDHSLIRLVF